MATPWSSSSRRGGAILALLLGGCVTTTTVAYVPEANAERLSLEQGEELLAQFVGAECPRLVEERKAERVTRVELDLDNRGMVTEARLDRSIGDDRLDGIIGAVAAKLHLDPPAGQRRSPEQGELRAGYRCESSGAPYVVLQRL
ncbi:MAG TPA: hypothetical protein VFY16_01590 [Gemmatimonadaceae bacterium]|nr:hypothetical protein [Gemmatimonadaceae bacterium]